MNELVIIRDKQAITTSLKIAEVFEKRHDNIMRDIRNLEIPNDFRLLNFEETEFIDKFDRVQPMYEMTRDGFTLLAMGFTGEKAMKFKIAYIEAFNQMEFLLKRDSCRKQKQLSELDADTKASRYFQNKITEGQKAGLSKQDAVVRAYSITLQQTGYDFLDAIPDSFKSSPVALEAPDLSLDMFVKAWWTEFKDNEVGVKELFPLITREDIPLKLTAESDRGIQVQFSNIIRKLKNRCFRLKFGAGAFDVIVSRGAVRHNASLWYLKPDEKHEQFIL